MEQHRKEMLDLKLLSILCVLLSECELNVSSILFLILIKYLLNYSLKVFTSLRTNRIGETSFEVISCKDSFSCSIEFLNVVNCLFQSIS